MLELVVLLTDPEAYLTPWDLPLDLDLDLERGILF
jgi:hypothetical protein